MKKGVFGKVLTMIITLITAAIALVLIWSILEKITGFSIGLLGESIGRATCTVVNEATDKVPGGKTTIGAGGGALVGGLLGAGACLLFPPCVAGVGVGAVLVGGAFIGALGGGVAASQGVCS